MNKSALLKFVSFEIEKLYKELRSKIIANKKGCYDLEIQFITGEISSYKTIKRNLTKG